MHQTENLNIEAFQPMPTPDEIHNRVPMTINAERSVVEGRRALEAILDRRDPRLFVVVGPCSIHDPLAGLDYARRLKADFEPLTQRRLVLLYTGGGILPERAWPAAHYAELARALCADGHAVGLIGLADDRALAQQIRAECASAFCFDLTGYTRSIRELLMLFHQAALLVTNDGGPGHFASLTPVPTFMFFGPETARLYGPLSPRTTVFDLQLPCSPCLSAYNHRQTFCDGDNQCLKRIAPDPVLTQALAFLRNSALPA